MKKLGLLAIFGAIGTALTIYSILYYALPNVRLYYYPQENTSILTLENLGNVPIENIEFSYSLNCQHINIPEGYINYNPPILTPITGNQYSYQKQLDNLTISTVENSISNSKVCQTPSNPQIYFVSYKDFGQFFNVSSSYSVCDKCDLVYSAKYSYSLFGFQMSGNESSNYPFTDPLNVTIDRYICYWWNQTPTGFPTPSYGSYNCFTLFSFTGPLTYNLKSLVSYYDKNETGIFTFLGIK